MHYKSDSIFVTTPLCCVATGNRLTNKPSFCFLSSLPSNTQPWFVIYILFLAKLTRFYSISPLLLVFCQRHAQCCAVETASTTKAPVHVTVAGKDLSVMSLSHNALTLFAAATAAAPMVTVCAPSATKARAVLKVRGGPFQSLWNTLEGWSHWAWENWVRNVTKCASLRFVETVLFPRWLNENVVNLAIIFKH